MPTAEGLTDHLRDALDHLYEPGRLRGNSLAAELNVAGRPDTPFVLRQLLTDTIESLKPGPEVPAEAPVWRAYEILSSRYVHQFSQKEVAEQLGLSVRQIRREQEAALGLLLDQLRADFELAAQLDARIDTVGHSQADPKMITPSFTQEVAWMKEASPNGSANVAQVVSTVLGLVRPLADKLGVDVRVDLRGEGLPALAVHPFALQEALLSVLIVAMHHVPDGQITLSAQTIDWEVHISAEATNPRPGPRPAWDDDTSDLNMARQLLGTFGASLAVQNDRTAFTAVLELPALQQFPVLAIDDSEDSLLLFRRYTTGTRYRIVGARDPQKALSLVEQTLPRIILLDVMMPVVDGWQLLGRLRQHPLSTHTPIIVCTILRRQELAFALGASDFLQKPVTRQAVLEALDRQISTAKAPR
jgi:CheY-like chemotaxis protein